MGTLADNHIHLDLIGYCELSGRALCITDRKGIILYVNDAYCHITGLDKKTCIGKPEPFDDPVSKHVSQTGQAVIHVRHFTNEPLSGGRYITAVPVFDSVGNRTLIAITVESDSTITRRYMALAHEKQRVESAVRIYETSEESSRLPILLGHSKAIEKVKKNIRRVAPTQATVLITGESGAGKEVIADCIHRLSNRSEKPFIKVNCAALPANLLESELFGYEKGAFTGASPRGRSGLFEAANGGTIFLDEIGDFPLELQPKLLRVLQHKEFYRVGGNTPIRVDIRILAATNSNLLAKVENGSFREDLYYRLCIFPIQSPPLRDRPEDLDPLITHFLETYCKEYNRNIEMSPTIMNILMRYNWPGNVRELQNVVEYYVICSDEHEEMPVDALLSILRQPEKLMGAEPKEKGLYQMRDEYERRLIIETLDSSKNAREAAKKLGISPATLYRKIQQHQIPLDSAY